MEKGRDLIWALKVQKKKKIQIEPKILYISFHSKCERPQTLSNLGNNGVWHDK